MDHNASLELVSVSKRFGDVFAVDDLSLSVRKGEFISILGPSGCGKSTTLRMILGLESPTSGEIRVASEIVTHHSPKERQVGIVFQDYAIFPHLSPRENVAFGLKMARVEKRFADREVAEITDLLHLQPILQKKTRDLNAAELQQIAIARTLVTKPKVVLFDEPLSNLEAFVRTRVRAQLRSLQRELGQTAVFVTHDQAEAMALSDRIAVMNHGRLQQYGTPEELYTAPSNLFVAGFIGGPPMNLLPGHARVVGDVLVFSAGTFEKHLQRGGIEVSERQPVYLGIRPEEIELVPSNAGWFNGSVESVEHLGSEAIVTVRAGASTLSILAHPSRVPALGGTVGVLPGGDVRLFDSGSGVLIHSRRD